ncbi:MAG: hypothetical protein PUH97_06050, partial [Dialister sp.]|nr:hypothetical protein [Dialister sp.]MDY5377984.1 hypothetical protein [Dialister sp.]
MDFVANDMKFDYFIIKQWGGRFKVQGSRFRVQGSGFRVQGSGFKVQGSGFRKMRNEGGGFAANIYGAIREKRCRTP